LDCVFKEHFLSFQEIGKFDSKLICSFFNSVFSRRGYGLVNAGGVAVGKIGYSCLQNISATALNTEGCVVLHLSGGSAERRLGFKSIFHWERQPVRASNKVKPLFTADLTAS